MTPPVSHKSSSRAVMLRQLKVQRHESVVVGAIVRLVVVVLVDNVVGTVESVGSDLARMSAQRRDVSVPETSSRDQRRGRSVAIALRVSGSTDHALDRDVAAERVDLATAHMKRGVSANQGSLMALRLITPVAGVGASTAVERGVHSVRATEKRGASAIGDLDPMEIERTVHSGLIVGNLGTAFRTLRQRT